MKIEIYYKLKKDLPTFKAGDTFYIDKGNGSLYSKDESICAYHYSTLNKFPNILDDWFEKIEVVTNEGRHRVDNGEYYYNITDMGGRIQTCRESKLNNTSKDNCVIGNYFLTRERAEEYREYLLSRERILSNSKNCTTSAYEANKLNYEYSIIVVNGVPKPGKYYFGQMAFPIFFATKEAAFDSLNRNKRDWDTLARYDFVDNFQGGIYDIK